MDIENFFELWFHTGIVHILVRCPESVKEEVDGTHNLLLPREMLDKVCVLSWFEEVCIEENGILFRVEGSECVDISICDFRISVKAGAQERPMPVLLVIILRFVRYMLLFYSV